MRGGVALDGDRVATHLRDAAGPITPEGAALHDLLGTAAIALVLEHPREFECRIARPDGGEAAIGIAHRDQPVAPDQHIRRRPERGDHGAGQHEYEAGIPPTPAP